MIKKKKHWYAAFRRRNNTRARAATSDRFLLLAHTDTAPWRYCRTGLSRSRAPTTEYKIVLFFYFSVYDLMNLKFDYGIDLLCRLIQFLNVKKVRV